MSKSHQDDSGAVIDFDTARGRDWPSVRQFNVFVANRLGGLADVVRRFETTDIRIVSLTVVDSADCAIIRLVLSDPERALEIFAQAKLPVTESDLLVVQLPDETQPLLRICKALLAGEINIHYAYQIQDMFNAVVRSTGIPLRDALLAVFACFLDQPFTVQIGLFLIRLEKPFVLERLEAVAMSERAFA